MTISRCKPFLFPENHLFYIQKQQLLPEDEQDFYNECPFLCHFLKDISAVHLFFDFGLHINDKHASGLLPQQEAQEGYLSKMNYISLPFLFFYCCIH